MIEVSEDMPGIEEAMKALDALELESNTPGSATEEQRAAQGEPVEVPDEQQQIQTDALATPKESPDKTDVKDVEPVKSRDEKAAERLPKSWKEFNERRTQFEQEREKHNSELTKRTAEIEARQREVDEQASEPTAQDYEAHAGRLLAQVKAAEAEAVKLEEAGKYDEAEAKRKQAQRQQVYAEDAMQAAEQVRKNPPDAKRAQLEQKREASKKEWTLKAAADFPDIAKNTSPLNKAATEFMQVLSQNHPDIARHPAIIYHAADYAAQKIGAARASDLEKKLVVSQARVKELEALTSPGGDGITTQPGAPAADGMDALMETARQMGTI